MQLSLCAFHYVYFTFHYGNETMSVSSKINEIVCPLSDFESEAALFSAKLWKGSLSELTAGRIFPDFPAVIKSSFGFSFVF